MKKKKYPVLWWKNQTAMNLLWIEICALFIVCVWGYLADTSRATTLLFGVFVFIVCVVVEIALHYRARTYILIRPEGVMWRGLFGNKYVEFNWEEIQQVGIIKGEGNLVGYFSVEKCDSMEKLIQAEKYYLGPRMITLVLSKKMETLFKETVNQYLAPEKWVPDMDQDGNWIPEDGRPVWVPIDEWKTDKKEH